MYFLNYYGFSAFVMGRSRYRVLKHGVRVKCDPRRTAAYVPSHFHGFEPHLLLCVSLNCDFSWTSYWRDPQQVPLDLAYLKPKICATQAISMHFSRSKSTKCEIFAWNCDFSGTTWGRDLKSMVLDVACLKPKYAPLKPFQCIVPSQKSTKCEIFVWNCDFFWNCLLHRLKTCGIRFGICQTLHMCYSSHFNAFFPVEINKMWNFCLKL